jgi:CheY-like chemotaxis protein
MAIHQFMRDFSISPANSERLVDAFQQTRRALDLHDASGPLAQLVARKIIEAHCSGVDSPDALAKAVVGQLRSETAGRPDWLLEGCSVLIVEDEYFLADDLRTAFKSLGAEVVGPVGDLDAALEKAEDGGFDFAIIDVRLRGRDAFDLADRLAARKIPFAFATGFDESAMPKRFAGAMRWTKPYDPLTLARAALKLWPG